VRRSWACGACGVGLESMPEEEGKEERTGKGDDRLRVHLSIRY